MATNYYLVIDKEVFSIVSRHPSSNEANAALRRQLARDPHRSAQAKYVVAGPVSI